VGGFAGPLSAIALDYYFIPPIYALGISTEEAPDMIAFVASALFASWLTGEQKGATDSLREARDKLDAKLREGTRKLRQTEDQSQVGTAGHRTVEDGLTLTRAGVAREARITTMSELATPIADELLEAEELGLAVEGRTPAPEKIPTVLFDCARESFLHPPNLCLQEESVSFRQGDY
jgi:K+-sensing histidine kinase KdpD